MRILVCGGRDYTDFWKVDQVLDNYYSVIRLLIHGAARGADSLAEEWAKDREVPYLGIPAKWKLYGKKAGYLRNKEMLTWHPNLVIAFPGNKGTANMIKLAEEAGVEVIKVE